MSWSTSTTSAPVSTGDPPDDAGEVLGLLVGQPGGGLVEQHDPGLTDDGSGHLDETALPGAEHADLLARVRRSSPTKPSASSTSWRREPRRAARVLVHEEDVLEHRQVGDRLLGLEGAPQPPPGAAEVGHGEQVLAEGRDRADVGRTKPLSTLKNVVLPAPFGPMRPHVPPGNVTVIRSSGMTPPNRTVRSSTSIMAGHPSPCRSPSRSSCAPKPFARSQPDRGWPCPSGTARPGHPAP